MELERYDSDKHGLLMTGRIRDVIQELTTIECPSCGTEMTAIPKQEAWAPGSIRPIEVHRESFLCPHTGCGQVWVEIPGTEHQPVILDLKDGWL